MQTVVTMIHQLDHKTTKGELFRLCLKKKTLSEQHNYWLYFIEAEHKSWNKQGFAVFVTKQSFPTEQVADHLASTLAIETAKVRLEEATETGRPMYFPAIHEGWAIT